MIKKTLLGIVISAGMTGGAIAVEPSVVEFDVHANVPTSTFYVTKDGTWDSVILNYDPEREQFDTNNDNYLRARNTNGSISGYLDHEPVMMHEDLSSSVPLYVVVNGKELGVGSANAISILTDAEANVDGGVKIPLAIGSTMTTVPSGNFSGRVTMMFDAVTP